MPKSPGSKPLPLGTCNQAAQGFLIAALLSKQHPGRVWVFCPHARRRDQLAEEFAFWKSPVLNLADPTVIVEDELVDPDREAERISTINRISRSPGKPVLLSRASWQALAPARDILDKKELTLTVGQEISPEDLITWLEERDYEEYPQIFQRGQFARRGGILDFYPTQNTSPIRVEFFGDEIESLREFSVESQTTTRKLDTFELGSRDLSLVEPLSNWFEEGDLLIAIDEDDVEIADILISDGPNEHWNANLYPSPAAGFEAGDFVIADSSRNLFLEQLSDWLKQGWEIGLVSPSKAERHRFLEILERDESDFTFTEGRLAKGFVAPEQKLVVLSTLEIFGRQHLPGTKGREALAHQRTAAAITGVHELNQGEFVVHADYGIGEFIGLIESDEGDEELGIKYDGGSTLHVPIDQSHLVARYVGIGGGKPRLNKLGDKRWKKARKIAEAAVLDYAAQLLRLQAERESKGGYGHAPDGQWMQEFEASFPFTETPDQRTAIEATKIDMESPRPMDRLICGDVGFGKTEIAIRAAFKAVTGGKQVAILAPTTVLAEQHVRTFRSRMSDYPVRVELLSRLQTPAETREILEGVRDGNVDILIGTHRLLSAGVEYKKIGLLVVDEEQRFGVRHKEILKERFRLIDVLTLSATPIPRTLYLSLMGARDMSTIDTPPPNRLPVQTSICAYDERLIRNAIRRELTRGGQVFFLHNRVATIEGMKTRIEKLVPEARVVVGHGQMDKDDLEKVMHQFVDGKTDVLLATTIIESGIDIPNANTILIDRADRFGLADLYQLRGRVGRADRRAYALLLLPDELIAGGDARKRLSAIKQYTELGSGFKIAMRDLEIRGAGSLLGTKQSGHITAVGFELYCQLLQQSIESLNGKNPMQRADAQLRIDFVVFAESSWSNEKGKLPAFFPRSYGPDSELRVAAYRQMASARTEKELNAISRDWRDRFGRFPNPIVHLIETNRLRIIASAKGVQIVEIHNDRLKLQRNGDYILPPGGKFPRLSSKKPADKLLEAVQLLKSL
ncbi:transcription-repair coupling factor [Akkermansiaceae bacterium]|nr:transcription-repair coupling factor [Akkermansiaceae bacterium]MDB4730766.1 transcription-repair coupling factor [Akkermansiaceae bacterium]